MCNTDLNAVSSSDYEIVQVKHTDHSYKDLQKFGVNKKDIYV